MNDQTGESSESGANEQDEMDGVINEFLVESFENLDQLDRDLVELEQNPTDESLLGSIFRTIHTIKGTCGFLGFSKLESLAHVGENFLGVLRDGKIVLNPEGTSGLLSMVDGVRQILSCIESDRSEGDVDYSELKDVLSRLTKGESAQAPAKPAAESETESAPQKSEPEAGGGSGPETSESGGGDEMDGVVNEFLVESNENLDQLDRDLVALEQDPTEKELLSNIFRTIHTIKGTCGFLGYTKLESLAHVGENLLSKLRDGELTLNAENTSALLSMVDAVRQILSCIESQRNEGDVDYSALVEALSRLTRGETASAPAKPETAPAVAKPQTPAAPSEPAKEETPVAVDRRSGNSTQEAERSEKGLPDRRKASPKMADASIRVDVELLDKLMNLVGELVLARNQIVQHAGKEENKDSGYTATTQHLNLLTTELQEGVMKTRMQPIGNIWSKFPRVVRDLSVGCGKKVRIEMEGKETELDKTIIEAIKDPLTHIVRNSVDHGIEDPQTRAANGKPEEGLLFLRAFHEGGQVIIEIKDDGGGIDSEKIKAKALEKGVITPEQSSRMSDRELVNLIFAPGFSTAAKVTNVSGRGVGMDVVKTNIEKIGGTVDIQSKLNEGTSLKVKIPLTLAIIPALIVTCGGGRYAIPQVSLLELVRLDNQDVRGIELIHGAPVYRLRGRLLPLIYLNNVLGVKKKADDPDDESAQFIVVLQADDRQFGLIVEGIADTEEIVVKPLGKQLKGITSVAGATIMGDGKVALILDIMGLAQEAHVVSEVRDHALGEGAAAEAKIDAESQNLLVFSIGDKGCMAILLDMVGRLEEFDRSTVEHTGTQDVVQYRGEIMPLIYLSHFFNVEMREDQDPMQAVVYSENGRSVGLVVDQIIDIVEETISIKKNAERPGILGTAVIKERVTDLIDVRAVIGSAIPNYYQEQVPALAERT